MVAAEKVKTPATARIETRSGPGRIRNSLLRVTERRAGLSCHRGTPDGVIRFSQHIRTYASAPSSLLARIMHEPPAATEDMFVLPGVLGSSLNRLRTSSPCDVSSGREVCSAKAHSRGIDSGEPGQVLGRGCGGKLGGHCCHPRKVEAPNALCAADPPASSAAPVCPRPVARPSPRSRDGVSCIMRAKGNGTQICADKLGLHSLKAGNNPIRDTDLHRFLQR